VSTQVPPQLVAFGRQVHALPTHISPAAHRLPQAPQWSALLVTSVQVAPTPPHLPLAGQPQLPPRQAGVAPLQTFPQAPQFAGSEVVSTHSAPHTVAVHPASVASDAAESLVSLALESSTAAVSPGPVSSAGKTRSAPLQPPFTPASTRPTSCAAHLPARCIHLLSTTEKRLTGTRTA